MWWIICSFNKQPSIRESSHFSRHAETGCLSGGDIMTEGIIGGSENEKENWAEPPNDERRRIWGDKRPKWSAERPGEKTGFFLSHSFICLCLSGRAKVIHVCPSNAVGSSPGDLRGGWTSKGFGSKTRWGELWPLSGSPWWLLLCLLSHQTFVAHFSLSFSARGLFCPADMATDSQTPQKNILTDRTSVVVDVRSDSCWRFKPQIGFTTDHSSKLITPSKGAICKSSLVAVKSQTFRPFPCVYHPVSQCWIVKNERRPQQKARMQTSRHCAVHIKLTLGYPGVTVVKLCRLTKFASGERTDSVSRVFMSSTPGSHCCVYERVCLCVSRVINMCDGSNCMLPIFTKVKTGSLQWLLFGNANDYWVSSGSGIESHHFLTKMWRLQQVTKTCPDS